VGLLPTSGWYCRTITHTGGEQHDTGKHEEAA